MVHGFYWLIDGGLAGCGRPGGPDSARNDNPAALQEDLRWLRGQGIEAILSLTETPLALEVIERNGIEALHLPVPDMTAPSPDQLLRALAFIDAQRAFGRSVAVHCRMGQGRTGTVLAAYLIRGGMTAEEAIAQLRTVCPLAVESEGQRQALRAFEQRRDWIL